MTFNIGDTVTINDQLRFHGGTYLKVRERGLVLVIADHYPGSYFSCKPADRSAFWDFPKTVLNRGFDLFEDEIDLYVRDSHALKFRRLS